MAGVWCGVAFLAFYIVGLWLMSGFVPAHKPTASADAIALIYRSNTNGIRMGMLFVMIAAALYLPWTVTLSALIRTMEGEATFLSQCQLLGGLASSFFFVLPALIWQVAAFRPERSPELILMLNDAGWILTVTPVPPFLVQFLPLVTAIFINRNKPDVFPRWMGFASLWACVLYSPAVVAYFLKTGPFAWNGLFSFWIPLSIFVVWELFLYAMAGLFISRHAQTST
jgi:hypothetical protein